MKDWSHPPCAPYRFYYGTVDAFDEWTTIEKQVGLTIEEAVALVVTKYVAGRKLGSVIPEQDTAAMVIDASDVRVLAYAGSNGGGDWEGVEHAFFEMARQHDPLEVTLFELEAQEYGLLRGKT